MWGGDSWKGEGIRGMYELAASKGCHIHGGGWTERKREKEGGFLPTGVKQESIPPSPSFPPPPLPPFLLCALHPPSPPPSFLAFRYLSPQLLLPCSVLTHEATERSVSSGGERKRELLLCLLPLPQLLSYSYNNSSCCLLLLLQLVQFRTDCVPPPALPCFSPLYIHTKCRALFSSLAPPFYPSLSAIIISLSNPLLDTPFLPPFPCFLFIPSHSILSLARMYKVRCVCMYMLTFSITVSINCSLHVI